MLLRSFPNLPNPRDMKLVMASTRSRQLRGKSKKGNASGDTKFIPCAFFNTERGCLKGKDCEYMHAAPKGAKAKGKFKEAEAKAKAKPGAKERTAAKEAEAKAKAKPDAKAKAAALFGAEAKSAITICPCESDSNSDNRTFRAGQCWK